MKKRFSTLGLLFTGTLLWGGATKQNLLPYLEEAVAKQRWNEVIQTSADILRQDPRSSRARLRGAFGLIQRGYPNAALNLLRHMSADDWKAVPKDMVQVAEVVALFQKKVPFISMPARIEQLNEAEASDFLRDEIRFAKGRAAFERADFDGAKTWLLRVRQASRFFGPANYLLGALSVKRKAFSEATDFFSRTLDPQVLQQSSEFWQDLAPQMANQWGNSIAVELDTEALKKGSSVAELSILAIARVLYAQKDFKQAVTQYGRIPRESPLFYRARLETVWALLQQEKHDEAQQMAADLSMDEAYFESFEARPVRALILVDSGKPAAAREEITRFAAAYSKAKEGLTRYRQLPTPETLPTQIKTDAAEDKRIDEIYSYQSGLKDEIGRLRAEDGKIFPVYSNLAADLEPLIQQSSQYANGLVMEHVNQRTKDLDRLYVQTKLILAETYLEERELLRAQFKGKPVDEAGQDAHDRRLVNLLQSAIKQVDEARALLKTRNPSLDFRQSELLWELSSASAFLKDNEAGTTGKEAFDNHRKKAIEIVRKLVDNQAEFPKRPQAVFFLGFALMEIGLEKEGLNRLKQFTAQYPKHENVPNAYRILADAEFDSARYKQAEELYDQILKFPESPIIGYALYKIGWCNYNKRDTAKALLGLEQAVLWTRSLENTEHLLNLKREAGRDLISIYAEVGNHKRAHGYFERFLGGTDANLWLADLAREFERNGVFEKSNDLYTQLLTLNPSPENRMRFQASIINGSYQLRNWNLVLDRTRDLVNGFDTVLQPEQGPDAPAYRTETVLNEAVLAQHFEFDQNAAKEDVERILAIDELYLRAFDKWKSAQMPLYQYAHVLMKYGKSREAMMAFTNHWERFQTTLQEPLKEEALRNVIQAMETVDQERETDASAAGKRLAQFLKYTGDYAALYPTSQHLRAMEFLRSVTLLKHDRNEEGIQESQKVSDHGFSDDFGKRAFQNLRVAYYKLKDWKRTFEWSSAQLKKPGMEKTSYLADLKTIREESLFLMAENTADNLKAAELYMEISQDPQMIRLRPKAIYNAFVRYKEAGNRSLALAVAKKLETGTPRSPELLAIAGVRAAFYQEAGDYEKALPLYREFLKSPPKDTAPEVIEQARSSATFISETLSQGKRQPASQNHPLKSWDALMAAMQDLQKNPLAKGTLPQKIQGGAMKLEKAVRRFLEVSADPQIPGFYALESYCAIPFLYTYYQKGIRALGDGQTDDLKAELEKLASPLDLKSLDVAGQCLARSMESFHDGPYYRKTLETWGWQKNASVTAQANRIRDLLGKHAPWLEPIPMPLSEAELIQSHLEEKGNADSWYSLGCRRMLEGKTGLAKLTFVAALTKSPGSARILNAMAVLKQMEKTDPSTLDTLFHRAGEAGSGAGWANLALLHLNGARLQAGQTALDGAEKTAVFADKPELISALAVLKTSLNPRQPASNDASQSTLQTGAAK